MRLLVAIVLAVVLKKSAMAYIARGSVCKHAGLETKRPLKAIEPSA